MIVIHPQDRTTAFLSAIYQGIDCKIAEFNTGKSRLRSLLYHAAYNERILMLGHGSSLGLFTRNDDTKDEFHLLVDHSFRYELKRHDGNMIGIWCNAIDFAKEEGLHGLFTGMIISEMNEAALYNIGTSQNELDQENAKLSRRLRELLDKGTPLPDIPLRIRELDDSHTPLTDFNYSKFTYI